MTRCETSGKQRINSLGDGSDFHDRRVHERPGHRTDRSGPDRARQSLLVYRLSVAHQPSHLVERIWPSTIMLYSRSCNRFAPLVFFFFAFYSNGKLRYHCHDGDSANYTDSSSNRDININRERGLPVVHERGGHLVERHVVLIRDFLVNLELAAHPGGVVTPLEAGEVVQAKCFFLRTPRQRGKRGGGGAERNQYGGEYTALSYLAPSKQ